MKDYSFPGEVTLSIEQYNEMLIELHEAREKIENLRTAFNSVYNELEELKKKQEDDF